MNLDKFKKWQEDLTQRQSEHAAQAQQLRKEAAFFELTQKCMFFRENFQPEKNLILNIQYSNGYKCFTIWSMRGHIKKGDSYEYEGMMSDDLQRRGLNIEIPDYFNLTFTDLSGLVISNNQAGYDNFIKAIAQKEFHEYQAFMLDKNLDEKQYNSKKHKI